MSQPRRRHWLIDGRPRLACALLILAALSIGMLLFEGSRPAAASSGVAPFPHFDKVLHFGAHGWVAGLLFWGGYLLGRPQSLRMRAPVWAGLVLLVDGLAGVAVEFVQKWLGANYGRQFDWKDVTANVAGAAFAVGASCLLVLLASRQPR